MGYSRVTTPRLVTIGVPTYNRSEQLRDTLDGLLRQDYRPIEIIVSDNHSTDDTASVGAEYSRQHGCVRYLRQPEPVPVVENFRTVLRLAQGEFFMWASDDDERLPAFVRTLVDTLHASPVTVLAAAEAQYRLSDGSLLPFFPEGRAWYGERGETSAAARISRVVRYNYGNLIHGLYRTCVLRDGPNTVLEGWRSINEIPVFLQVAARGEIRVLPDVLWHKTVPLTVYLAAAREYDFQPPLAIEDGNPPDWRRVARLTQLAVWYHVTALVDAMRAASSLPLPLAIRARAGAAVTRRIGAHCVTYVLRDIRQERQR